MADSKQVIQVAVPRPLHSVYDYHVDAERPLPKVGARLRVPFGRSEVIGICISTEVDNPHTSTKAVIEVLDTEAAIAPELLTLAQWMQHYYHYPLGEVRDGTPQRGAHGHGTCDQTRSPSRPMAPGKCQPYFPGKTSKPSSIICPCRRRTTGEASRPRDLIGMLRKLEGMNADRKAAHQRQITKPLTPSDEQQVAINVIHVAVGFNVFC